MSKMPKRPTPPNNFSPYAACDYNVALERFAGEMVKFAENLVRELVETQCDLEELRSAPRTAPRPDAELVAFWAKMDREDAEAGGACPKCGSGSIAAAVGCCC